MPFASEPDVPVGGEKIPESGPEHRAVHGRIDERMHTMGTNKVDKVRREPLDCPVTDSVRQQELRSTESCENALDRPLLGRVPDPPEAERLFNYYTSEQLWRSYGSRSNHKIEVSGTGEEQFYDRPIITSRCIARCKSRIVPLLREEEYQRTRSPGY